MADAKLSALAQETTPSLDDFAYLIDGTPTSYKQSLGRVLGLASLAPCGRLTLSSGVPVTTSDVTAATTIYFTPFGGNTITLWNGSAWQVVTFVESDTTLALGTMTASIGYDVFAFLNSGVANIEKLAWTSATARATAVTLQDGRYCKSGDKTRLYLGSFYAQSTTFTESSARRRFLWPMYNPQPCPMRILMGNVGVYSYAATNTWRASNADTTNMLVEVFVGLDIRSMLLKASTFVVSGGSGMQGLGGIGKNRTNGNDAHWWGRGTANDQRTLVSVYEDFVGSIGYTYFQQVEASWDSNPTSFGSDGAAYIQGMAGGWFH